MNYLSYLLYIVHEFISAGNRKRKMPEQTLSSPKNCILCPPEVKRNKRGETPLHVAAIKVHCDKTDF